MELGLSGKVALITGSTTGIGLEIARSLYKEGCKVIINGRDKEKIKKVLKELPEAFPIIADVTENSDVKKLINKAMSEFKKLDIVICNVGSGTSAAPGQETITDWQASLSVNLYSATNIIEATKKEITKNNGVYLCISSICGLEVINSAPLTYSASKAALMSYIKGASRPLGRLGVRINAIAPGNILFEGSIWNKKMKTDPKGTNEFIKKEVALGKFGSTEDVAHLSTFLVSPLAKFITGSIYTVDGGQVRS